MVDATNWRWLGEPTKAFHCFRTWEAFGGITSGLREFLAGMLRASADSGSPTSAAVGFRFRAQGGHPLDAASA
jgi:hypothetical protein